MQPFRCHRGVAAPLLKPNIDTDAIIPSREMRQVSRKGLSSGLFANWRYTDAAARLPDPRFVLNRPEYANATILLCGSNFGCGSSREFAVWALAEFGIRVIVAPSFGAIFQKNCIANGVLSAIVPDAAVKELARWVEDDPPSRLLTVDLATLTLGNGLGETPFMIAEADRVRLLRGLDPISHTMTRAGAIRAFEKQRHEKQPWARVPPAADGKSRAG